MPEIFFIGFAAVFVFIVVSCIMRFVKNENSPVVATNAKCIDKKSDFHTHSNADGSMHTSETLYLIFELDTSSTIKFSVSGRIYRNAVLHEWGTLTFQGTRFLKFESPGGVIEK